jgi:hypothetical protein
MKAQIKALTITGLALTFCFTPISNVQAHGSERYARQYSERHQDVRHYKKHRTYNHKRAERARYEYKHPRNNKIVLNNVVIHKRSPSKVIYVYKKHDSDYKDKLLAVTLAQTAILLALD